MTQKVTITDIANEMGISKSTVSKALSDATDISDEMRQQVLLCASRMGYKARAHRHASNKAVAVFLENTRYDEVSQFCHEVILGFQAEAGGAQVGVNIITLESMDAIDDTYSRLMSQERYSGSFFIGFRPHSQMAHRFNEIGKPVVLLDNPYDSPLTARIGTDSNAGMRAAVRHLTALGHTKIAYLGGEESSYVTQERKNGYICALQESGLSVDENLIAFAFFYKDFSVEIINKLLLAGATAFICASDMIAICLIEKLHSLGLAVPDAVSVVGYDGIPLTLHSHPQLTTVSQNGMEVGKQAFRLLQTLLNGAHISQLVLRPQLLVRSSTAPLHNKTNY